MLDEGLLCDRLRQAGLAPGDVVIVHSSLSSLGEVDGGAATVVRALLGVLGAGGTLVVPAFTGHIADPYPGIPQGVDAEVDRARESVPLFTRETSTAMGAVPTAVLGHPAMVRSRHPQASVAAIGAHAADVTARQPLGYAVGKGSPFDTLHELGARILLIGVGHNRNSFLHYAESAVPAHRRKTRRFPYLVDGERVWVEVPDVGDDNDTLFPRIGAEYRQSEDVRTGLLGAAEFQLLDANPFVRFAQRRLEELLTVRRTGERG